MNRVDDTLSKMEQCVTVLELLEQEYTDKKRGEIYFSTRNYNQKKYESLKKSILGFGQITILEWVVRYTKSPFDFEEMKETIRLDSTITEQEIQSYYERVLRRKVTLITSGGLPITFKFPSKK